MSRCEKCGSKDHVTSQHDDVSLVESAALVDQPPLLCPICRQLATFPKKDEYGRWTWNCNEGCNP